MKRPIFPVIMLILAFTLFLWLSAYFFIFGEAAGFDSPSVLGFLAIASALALLLPECLRLSCKVRKCWTGKEVTWIQFLMALMFLLSWIGTFYGYRWLQGYDSFVHFSSGFFSAGLVLLVFGTLWRGFLKKKHFAFLIFIGLIVFGGLVNELFERFSDLWWGTKMYGQAGEPLDTFKDMAYVLAGAVIGSVICITRGSSWLHKLKPKTENRKPKI